MKYSTLVFIFGRVRYSYALFEFLTSGSTQALMPASTSTVGKDAIKDLVRSAASLEVSWMPSHWNQDHLANVDRMSRMAELESADASRKRALMWWESKKALFSSAMPKRLEQGKWRAIAASVAKGVNGSGQGYDSRIFQTLAPALQGDDEHSIARFNMKLDVLKREVNNFVADSIAVLEEAKAKGNEELANIDIDALRESAIEAVRDPNETTRDTITGGNVRDFLRSDN